MNILLFIGLLLFLSRISRRGFYGRAHYIPFWGGRLFHHGFGPHLYHGHMRGPGFGGMHHRMHHGMHCGMHGGMHGPRF